MLGPHRIGRREENQRAETEENSALSLSANAARPGEDAQILSFDTVECVG